MKPAKAIIRIGRNVKNGRRFVNYIYRDKARLCIGGDLVGGLTGDARRDYESLLLGHHNSGRLLRSLIISLDCPPTPDAIKDQTPRLVTCVTNFRDAFAPACPYLFALHKNGGKLHAHVLIRNSDGNKCLEWSPETLKEMQSFRWTDRFDTGRGKGVNQIVGKTSYPGKNTTAAKLAGMSVDDLKTLFGSGELAISRTRKDGSPLSLVCDGKKIRVQSVCVIATDFAARLVAAMTTDDGDYLLRLIQENCADEDHSPRIRGRSR